MFTFRPSSQIKTVPQWIKVIEFLARSLYSPVKDLAVMKEIWKTIKKHPIYDVSNLGRIRSWNGNNSKGLKRTAKPKILNPNPNGNGYIVMNFFYKKQGPTQGVHSMILETFVGPRPKGYDCCHNDGDKSNNHIDNLRWDTRRNNMLDKRKHGTSNRGERCGHSKLKDKDIPLIRELRKKGMPFRKIAAKFGIDHATAWHIVNRDYWVHIK